MKTKIKPIKKGSRKPITEAKGHPDGPSLTEMLNGEEEKMLRRKKGKKREDLLNRPISII